MRTENIHGFSSILLAFAIVLSMTLSITFTASPVLATGVVEEPGGSTITVFPKQAFTLQFKFEWDEPENLGYFVFAFYWDSPRDGTLNKGTENENFSFVSVSCYWEDNLDPITPVDLTRTDGQKPGDNTTWRYTLTFAHSQGTAGADNIFVDVVMRAAGAGGVPHIAPDNHNIVISGSIDVSESTYVSYTPPNPNIKIEVLSWTGGVIVQGKDNMYNTNQDGMPPYEDYTAGDTPPIMVGQQVDSGAFVAGGISATSRDGRWNSGTNTFPNLDNLLDAAFQWMVPGAENVLWWDTSDIYNNTTLCSDLVTALEALGYTVTGDDRDLVNMYTGYIKSYSGTITENLLATDDQYAIENDPTSAGYDDLDVHIGRFTYEDNDRAFIKWDLSALSAATSISSATLILDTYWDPDNDMTAGFYPSDDAWNEDNMCWDNMPTTPIVGDDNFDNTDPFTFATEWDNYAKDTFDFLGWHSGGLGLFISEYIEGSSYNKALEIYTSSTVDLSGYQIELYSNGKLYPPTSTQVLSGTLNSCDVYVIAHGSADAAILAVADLTSGTCNWNGDDGIVLRKISDNSIVDAIGEYGYDPGTEWPPSPGGGKDQTQVRKGNQIATLDMTQIAYGAWWNVDVTSYVQSEFAGDNVVSIMIKSENEDLPIEENHSCQFAAHERSSGVYGPFLEITYEGTIYKEYDYGLENIDILVINQLQRDYGDRHVGGDPDKLSAIEVEIIENFVRNGGGLLLGEGSDYGGHCYHRIQNKILDALDSDWNFQHDQATDDVDNWYGNFGPVADVLTTNPVGVAYEDSTGVDNIGLYSACTLYEPPAEPDPSVSATPAVQNASAGSAVSFTATVTNNGDGDRFLLSVSDNMGWSPTITPSYLDVGSGDSDTATVSVTIDNAAAYCTYDTLTVTATSVTDNTVSASGTAQAHSLGLPLKLRKVTVLIEPDNQEAVLVIDRDAVKKRYDPLTFKVVVTNEGKLNDKYILTATNGRGWMLELWPTELFLQPGENDFAVLSVTVPENEIGSTTKEIQVEAEGTMATGTGDDTENAKGLDKCEVHVAEARCVRLDVWPFQTQSATPGSKVRWIARVKNLGNVTNTYTISATNTVSDKTTKTYADADITLTPTTLSLPPCNWGQVQIDLDVPEDLKMSTSIDVTVTVKSDAYPACTDNAEVDVHVVTGIAPIPQGVIKLEVETEIIAIQVWPTYWDFGVLDETETGTSDNFTVRNIGNEPVDVTIAGNDAKSSPGELVTTWTLDDFGTIGLDRYAMWFDSTVLNKAGKPLVSNLAVSAEYNFDLTLKAPSSITVPSRMWTLVNLTAVEA